MTDTVVLLTAEEAARRIGCCVKTLGKLRRLGDLAFYKTATRGFRYSEADCDDYLARCRDRVQLAPILPPKRSGRVVRLGSHPRFSERHP